LAINPNGGIFVFEFRFSEKTYGVTQDGEAVEREANKRLLCSIIQNHIPGYWQIKIPLVSKDLIDSFKIRSQ
jgi:hypothetical protein